MLGVVDSTVGTVYSCTVCPFAEVCRSANITLHMDGCEYADPEEPGLFSHGRLHGMPLATTKGTCMRATKGRSSLNSTCCIRNLLLPR